MPHSLETALEEEVTSVPRSHDEDKLYGLADRPVSEEHPTSTIWPTQSRSSARTENTIHDQFVSIPGVVKDSAVRRFGGSGRTTESRPATGFFSVIFTVINGSIAKTFQSSVFQSSVERAVQKCLADSKFTKVIKTRAVDLRTPIVSVVKFVRNVVEKRSVEKAEMDRNRNVSNKSVVGHKKKAEDELQPQKMDFVRSPSAAIDIYDNKK